MRVKMRALWSGAMSFGLIYIPVNVYSGTEEHQLNLDMLHKKDLSPIRYARVCKAEEKEVPYEEIVKGIKYESGEYVILTDKDFERANVEKTKTIDILDFTNEAEIDSIYFEKPYFLEPGKGADKAYLLLREALRKSKKVGIARFVIRNREHIGVIKPYKHIIILNQLRFPSEIRAIKGIQVPEKSEVSKKEIDMALKLIDQLTSPFHPEKFHDTYTEEIEKIIEEKAHGKVPRRKGKPPKITPIHDIMSMLKESLKQKKKTA